MYFEAFIEYLNFRLGPEGPSALVCPGPLGPKGIIDLMRYVHIMSRDSSE